MLQNIFDDINIGSGNGLLPLGIARTSVDPDANKGRDKTTMS